MTYSIDDERDDKINEFYRINLVYTIFNTRESWKLEDKTHIKTGLAAQSTEADAISLISIK
jgi:hypothetical protein